MTYCDVKAILINETYISDFIYIALFIQCAFCTKTNTKKSRYKKLIPKVKDNRVRGKLELLEINSFLSSGLNQYRINCKI